MSRELGIEAAVAFTGWQTDMLAVQNYTQFADVGVCYMPDIRTVRAASNMKVFQYMAMGTVPVVSDVGDLRRYVQDGQAGVVVAPGNVEALADALIELLQDEERRVRMAKEAWRLAWGRSLLADPRRGVGRVLERNKYGHSSLKERAGVKRNGVKLRRDGHRPERDHG